MTPGERPRDPYVPDDVTGKELDRQVRAELRTLPTELAESVARHLVMAARLLGDDPEAALAHARAARRRAGRVAAVREAVGVAAYAAGDYAEALAELRSVARMTGSPEFLPLMADCERGLGRPRRALELARSAEAARLDATGRAEMLIVAAGARRDLGQDEAAVLTLQVPELRSRARAEWVARLRYAYADALEAVGRVEDARTWFRHAADVDVDGATDAADRLAALQGVVFLDSWDDDSDDDVADDTEDVASDGLPAVDADAPAEADGDAPEV